MTSAMLMATLHLRTAIAGPCLHLAYDELGLRVRRATRPQLRPQHRHKSVGQPPHSCLQAGPRADGRPQQRLQSQLQRCLHAANRIDLLHKDQDVHKHWQSPQAGCHTRPKIVLLHSCATWFQQRLLMCLQNKRCAHSTCATPSCRRTRQIGRASDLTTRSHVAQALLTLTWGRNARPAEVAVIHRLCRKTRRMASGEARAMAARASTQLGSADCRVMPPLARNRHPMACARAALLRPATAAES